MHALRVRKHGDPSHVDKGGRPRYGAEHPNWKGDQAGYLAIHVRLRTNRGHASAHPCAECGDVAAEWAYDHTDPNEQLDERGCPYSPDPAHYRPLCLSCHRSADARAVP